MKEQVTTLANTDTWLLHNAPTIRGCNRVEINRTAAQIVPVFCTKLCLMHSDSSRKYCALKTEETVVTEASQQSVKYHFTIWNGRKEALTVSFLQTSQMLLSLRLKATNALLETSGCCYPLVQIMAQCCCCCCISAMALKGCLWKMCAVAIYTIQYSKLSSIT